MLTIRPALPVDSPAIARLQVDSYRTAYAGFFPPAYLEQFSYTEQEQDWLRFFSERPEDILLVAQMPDLQLAGYCLAASSAGDTSGYAAELVALHVRLAHRRGGIGTALLRGALEQLAARGCGSVMLWTLQGNPVRAWYERLGGELIAQKTDDIDGWRVVEVAYGWRSTQVLIDRLSA